MAVRATCKCGKAVSARDDLAGKRVKCPACGAPLSIPTTRRVLRPCPICNKPLAAPFERCSACGWSRKIAARQCVKCKGAVDVDYGLGFGGSIAGVGGASGIALYYFFGLLGCVGVACATAALGGLTTALTMRHRCRQCGEDAPDGTIPPEEIRKVNLKRVGIGAGACALFAVAIGCGLAWRAVWKASDVHRTWEHAADVAADPARRLAAPANPAAPIDLSMYSYQLDVDNTTCDAWGVLIDGVAKGTAQPYGVFECPVSWVRHQVTVTKGGVTVDSATIEVESLYKAMIFNPGGRNAYEPGGRGAKRISGQRLIGADVSLRGTSSSSGG